ncbi:hypothetical protein M9H71_12335 [Rhodopseudomonas parapalustris]
MLEAAAEQSRTSLSEFVRWKSVEAAEIDVLSRSVVTMPAKDVGTRGRTTSAVPRGSTS